MKKYRSLISLIYLITIMYVWQTNTLKNFLAPSMQIYLKLSILVLIVLFVGELFTKSTYKFKVSDLILLLPILMLILSGDTKLSINLTENRRLDYSSSSSVKQEEKKEEFQDEKKEEVIEELPKEITTFDIDMIDSVYNDLSIYLTFESGAKKYENKTIHIKGYALVGAEYIPSGYFMIGKYSISCCAADAQYVGLYVKKNEDIKNNMWYDIVGVLKIIKDVDGNDTLAIIPTKITEIDGTKEEQYVYPCYSYDNGLCADIEKYNLD